MCFFCGDETPFQLRKSAFPRQMVAEAVDGDLGSTPVSARFACDSPEPEPPSAWPKRKRTNSNALRDSLE
jgi:hypothetical protein